MVRGGGVKQKDNAKGRKTRVSVCKLWEIEK
jgi:hypothetical protein